MNALELNIGFRCNNNCAFCVVEHERGKFPPKTLDEIRRHLAEGSARGLSTVIVTGGEPTIQEHFLAALSAAREAGYEIIRVQSNGRRFCYPDFCRQSLAAGANEFSVLLHGSNAPLHEYLTRAEGGFLQTVAGIRNLKAAGARVIVATTVVKTNYRDLPALAALAAGLGVDAYRLTYAHFVGAAASNRGMLARMALAVPWVKAALDVCAEAGIPASTEAIPLCLMADYEDFVDEEELSVQQCRRDEGRVLGPECGECRCRAVCPGPWREYAEVYGWSEFEPLSEALV